jgi:glyoxylase-like metal-dependent hydrolase (beta-lactamase superfamily II)
MRRNGIPEEIVRALQTVSSAFRAWGSKAKVTKPLRDGETLKLRDRSLQLLHRPGHSPSDTVFWDEDRRILIAADHLIKHISSNPLISRPLDHREEADPARRPQALVTYLESLRRTREMPAEIVLSGHGEPITDHVRLIDERFEFHRRRADKIYGLIAEQPRTGYDLTQAIFGDIAVTQAYLTLSEVLGHVDLLLNEGRVREVEQGGIAHFEAT